MIFPLNSWSGIIRRRSDINGLCLILDQEHLQIPPLRAMGEALEAGVRFFQYRSKKSSRRAVYEIALQLAGAAHRAGALFIVNDHVDIAVAVDADGVHLGQEDLPLAEARTIIGREKLIGISTHGREQASAAEKAGADYIGYGPVFRTPTKDAGPLQGTGGIRSVRQALSIPVVAIGGIRYDNLCSVIDAGADSVAVISAVLSASDLKQAAGDMVRLISAGRAKYQGGI